MNIPVLSAPRRSRAFTLIELLVAIAILMMLVTLMAGMIGSVSNAWSASRDKMDAFAKGRAVMNALQREVRSAIIRDDLASFPGSPGAFAFYTTTKAQSTVDTSARALTFVTYIQKDDSHGRPALYRQDKPFSYSGAASIVSPEWAEPGDNVVPTDTGDLTRQLCEGVYAFRYAFVQSDGTVTKEFVNRATAAKNAEAGVKPDSPTVAVQVSIAVVGEQGEDLAARLSLKNNLQQFFDLGDPTGSAGWSPKSQWDARIASGTGTAFRPQILNAIRTYERVIPLQTNSVAGL